MVNFLSRILAAIYQSELTKDENTYTDKVGLAAVFMITPNTGAFTNSHMDIGGTVYYRPNITEDESRYGFSFISSISY